MSWHTPGKWTAKRSVSNHRRFTIWSDSEDYGAAIAETANWLDSDPFEEIDANANLIAAAPELLEALEMLRRITVRCLVDSNQSYIEGIDVEAELIKANTAIAKAKGES